ncbi:MAG: Nif11-like leader peptide family natural product precursor [Planctomycetaceae bacterium]|nr:Nif11-like leader peptide family natural product precursor [Planctomycetaceae bacterium]MCP4401681.1 Nif11-like leader peptide family natural product precursor [bacterium]
MSVSEIERFGKDVEENTDLKEELIKAGAAEEAIVSFANGKGYDFTADEFKAEVEKKKADLSDEELEKVAAGGFLDPISGIAIVI